jgi:hypothetical protein
LGPTLAAADARGRDTWAIVRLDWDFPPYLEPLSADADGQRVDIAIEDGSPARVRVNYTYVQQDGHPERDSTIRLYQVAADRSRCLVAEGRRVTQLDLPERFSGVVQAAVTPASGTKVGAEYFSKEVHVRNSQVPVQTACDRPNRPAA